MAAPLISVSDAEIVNLLQHWLWPFLRVGGLMLTAPIIGTRALPRRVRLTFVIVVTAVLAPALPAMPLAPPLLSGAGLLVAVQQLVIGGSLGLVLRSVFLVLEFAGQVIAQQMGLGFAAMVDPQSGAQVPVIAQLYIVLATLLFFAADAHLALLRLLADSFTLLPVGEAGVDRAALDGVVTWTGSLLGRAVLIMMPIIVSLLVVNIAFGVMARAAPQLNIFAVGFPVMILFGTGMMLLLLGLLMPQVETIFQDGFSAAYGLLGAS